MPELLLEILSEEIPARMQARAADDLKRLVTDGLKSAGLEFTSAQSYVTPRRLTLVVGGLPEKQPDVSEERRGPNVNAPEQAINGFKGSLPEGAKIEERETPKGMFLFALVDTKGAATADVLIRLVSEAMANLPWPKSMRWATYPGRWVRPVHSMICVFGGTGIPAVLGEITASNTTVGHRFLAPDAFTVTDFADYKSKLLKAKVMLDPAERRQKIETDAKALCEKEGLSLKDDPGLLDEVTGLVEWPVVHMGTIDDQFMSLPDEVLSTSMRSHQKYFSTLDKGGKLANRFIVVANTETKDGGKQVIAGNERVLRARLSDAKFFWDQDRAAKLESRVDALADRVFHAKLGNLLEKVDRVEALAAEISKYVEGADEKLVKRAARLAKADLSTGMVGEFPELQGLMGRYYAHHDDEDAAVADAVAEHYSPLGPNDACPTNPVSVCVALADKIDTLVGFFAIDEKPTGSKDPYALRRAALGVIRLVLENKVRINLTGILSFGLDQYAKPSSIEFNKNQVIAEMLSFFADRLVVQQRDLGVRHDYLNAVFSQRYGGDEDIGHVDIVRVVKRVGALIDFLSSEDGSNLLTAYKRAANIVRIESEKDKKPYEGIVDPDKLILVEEIALNEKLRMVQNKYEPLMDEENFIQVMGLLAQLREPVDAFFDNVTVNSNDEFRENRLQLLSFIQWTMNHVADFSKIEGK